MHILSFTQLHHLDGKQTCNSVLNNTIFRTVIRMLAVMV